MLVYLHEQIPERDAVSLLELQLAAGHVFPEGRAHGRGAQFTLHSEQWQQQHRVALAERSEALDRDGALAHAQQLRQGPERCQRR